MNFEKVAHFNLDEKWANTANDVITEAIDLPLDELKGHRHFLFRLARGKVKTIYRHLTYEELKPKLLANEENMYEFLIVTILCLDEIIKEKRRIEDFRHKLLTET